MIRKIFFSLLLTSLLSVGNFVSAQVDFDLPSVDIPSPAAADAPTTPESVGGDWMLFEGTAAAKGRADEAQSAYDALVKDEKGNPTEAFTQYEAKEKTFNDTQEQLDISEEILKDKEAALETNTEELKKVNRDLAVVNAQMDVETNTEDLKKLETEKNKLMTSQKKLTQDTTSLTEERDNAQEAVTKNQATFEKAEKDLQTDPVYAKKQELTSAQNELTKERDKEYRDNMIKRLEEVNAKTSSFSVHKYLSVGNEANMSLIAETPGDIEYSFMDRVIRLAVQSLGTFGVLMMIVAGYFFITSEGDENRLQKGKNIFLYTIIGLLVAFISYAMVQFVLAVIFQ